MTASCHMIFANFISLIRRCQNMRSEKNRKSGGLWAIGLLAIGCIPGVAFADYAVSVNSPSSGYSSSTDTHEEASQSVNLTAPPVATVQNVYLSSGDPEDEGAATDRPPGGDIKRWTYNGHSINTENVTAALAGTCVLTSTNEDGSPSRGEVMRSNLTPDGLAPGAQTWLHTYNPNQNLWGLPSDDAPTVGDGNSVKYEVTGDYQGYLGIVATIHSASVVVKAGTPPGTYIGQGTVRCTVHNIQNQQYAEKVVTITVNVPTPPATCSVAWEDTETSPTTVDFGTVATAKGAVVGPKTKTLNVDCGANGYGATTQAYLGLGTTGAIGPNGDNYRIAAGVTGWTITGQINGAGSCSGYQINRWNQSATLSTSSQYLTKLPGGIGKTTPVPINFFLCGDNNTLPGTGKIDATGYVGVIVK